MSGPSYAAVDTGVGGPGGSGGKVPGGAALVLDRVGYRYPGGVTAIESISMVIPAKKTIAVVGPSGCGKSTLLQLLADIRRPTRGTISLGEKREGVHPMTMMFQVDTLLPWKTAVENVSLHFTFTRRRPRREAKRVALELLELVGLRDFADAYPYELSGGMRRRVNFLTSVAPKPAVLLLDEPFSSLDEPTRVAIHRDVIRIISEHEMTVVLVTHDLAEAITLSDEVVILTRRPSRVLSRHEVPFADKERDPLKLRHTQPFLELYGRLWEELSLQISGQTLAEEA